MSGHNIGWSYYDKTAEGAIRQIKRQRFPGGAHMQAFDEAEEMIGAARERKGLPGSD